MIALIIVVLELTNTLAKKLLPEKQTPTFRRGAKKMGNWTAEQIANYGRKKRWIS